MTKYELLIQELAQYVIDHATEEDHFSIIGGVAQNLIQYLTDTVDPA